MTPTVNFHHVDHDEHHGSMRTASGRWFNPRRPRPEDFDLGDIAHALARLCRFGGHTMSTYTVAEHSIYVAGQLDRTYGDPALAAAGLLHDAAEAYLGDVIRPVKALLPGYRALEAGVEEALIERFGVDLHDPRVKAADEAILPWEMVMYRDAGIRSAPDADELANRFLDVAIWYGVRP